MTTGTTDQLWAELWLRQDTYGTYEAQQEVLDQMERLEETGVLDTSTVTGWGKEVLTVEASVRSEALVALESFEDWAEEAGVSLEPGFERRTESPLLSTGTYEVAVFPVVCLALYEGNDVCGVFPCTDGEDVHTVKDALDTLAVDGAEPLLDAVGSDRNTPVNETPAEPGEEAKYDLTP